MEHWLEKMSGLIWSDVFIVLCVFTGIYFSIRLGFPQFTQVREMLRLLFQEKESEKGLSSFQAFSLAISGRVGTGNIVGVATAIAMGGPGSIFWMWLIAILGSASAFIESTLGQVYKREIDGEYRGGPAYYIEKGLGIRWYAILFAVIAVVCCGFLLPGVQSNSIAQSMNNAFGIVTQTDYFIPFNIFGAVVVGLLVMIIFGGVKRLGHASEAIIPLMAGAYILVGLIIIILNFHRIPEVFSTIISSAFGQDAVFGGILGSAIAWGVKRGIYSNEAGQGTGPHAASASEVIHPAEQGLVQAFSVYIDTLFVCTTTAFMILLSNVPTGSDLSGIQLTQAALESHIGAWAQQFLAVVLFMFAFTTIVGNYAYAETNIQYLHSNRFVLAIFRMLVLGFVYFGAVAKVPVVWDMGDLTMGIMATINLIVIVLMYKYVLLVLKDYTVKIRMGKKEPEFKLSEHPVLKRKIKSNIW